MLPKTKRLTTALVKEVFDKGRSVFDKDVSLIFIKKELSGQSRFAFSLSSKKIKKAVLRNKIKRQGFNILKKHIKEFKLGFLCVFVVKIDISQIEISVFERKIFILLKKAGILDT